MSSAVTGRPRARCGYATSNSRTTKSRTIPALAASRPPTRACHRVARVPHQREEHRAAGDHRDAVPLHEPERAIADRGGPRPHGQPALLPAQVVEQRLGGGIPAGRVLLKRLEDDGVEVAAETPGGGGSTVQITRSSSAGVCRSKREARRPVSSSYSTPPRA